MTAAVLLSTSLVLSGCTRKPAQAEGAARAVFRIGVVTGTASGSSSDAYKGAEELVRRYGSASADGMIRHITYPDDFIRQRGIAISRITALAEDPGIRAIVVNPGVPGTAEAFRRVRFTRPDILLLVGEPYEAPLAIQAAADLAVSGDFISRGYTIAWAARELGAETLVHISFPRHMSYEIPGRLLRGLREACGELGLRFVSKTGPDPLSGSGADEVRRFFQEWIPRWIQEYGAKTAFFAADEAYAGPLIRLLLAHGGLFVEASRPSPLVGFPEALGLDLPAGTVDFPSILRQVELAVVDRGGAGRFGTWPVGSGFAVTAGLGEFARKLVEGRSSKDSLQGLLDALEVHTPGVRWKGGHYVDAATGVRARNHFLVLIDTYVLGRGFLTTTSQEIDERFRRIRSLDQ